MRAAATALLLAALAGCAVPRSLPPQPERCEALFLRYDAVVRIYPNTSFDEDGDILAPGQVSRASAVPPSSAPSVANGPR